MVTISVDILPPISLHTISSDIFATICFSIFPARCDIPSFMTLSLWANLAATVQILKSRQSRRLSVPPYRYIAYASRVRTILHSASRYTAYACSVTENFRFFERRFLTRGVSAILWAYIIYDVVKEGCKAYSQNRGVLAPLSEAYKDARDLNITSTEG